LWLASRFGKRVRVEYYDLFDPACLLGGSTFENVIRLSKRPVLVVRQPS
jgi:nucleotide-binding universal stress UspA family protein